ncbi:MAG: DUF1330 domain-containing protein [Candidatus Latescibacteria bacterium]|nr:DUF1330 domain-containing protein [Candidatus Latescibacterota bacterium]
MAAYMIVDIEVNDPSTYERYKSEVPALISKHGGEYLVRGGDLEIIEGDWQPNRLVLFRFPDKESVNAFLNDPEYLPLKDLRQRVAKTDMVVVEGV